MNRILQHLLFPVMMFPLSAIAVDTQVTLQCDGRGTVSVVFAEYGLVTESWSPAFFETGTQKKDVHLSSGKPVAVWQFNNGDHLFQVKGTTGWFAKYRGDLPGTLHKCEFLEQIVLQPENLPLNPYR
ncbi:hypothetical protein B7044_19985 [Salmonella enterica]|nr:hypothetical protein [Salmonella enterica]ECO7559613.1 hypothetical protein [Salmonella enterica]EIY4144460.1 hypothetical protein [Salmonella enterica]